MFAIKRLPSYPLNPSAPPKGKPSHHCRSLVLILLILSPAFPGRAERLIYHDIQTDSKGKIIPWYSSDPAISYDYCIRAVWNWWVNLPYCQNGMKHYMVHMTWPKGPGLGGDQLQMALSSWSLLYRYTGDEAILDNMVRMADFYIDHALSNPGDAWPNLPYPYNTIVHSNPLTYDGDMVAGRGVLQPDKAGSLGAELMNLYKMTSNRRYLDVARGIADTLAGKFTPGDSVSSPWPFRVNAITGQVVAGYTSNWVGTMRLFDQLIELKHGDVTAYRSVADRLLAWLKNYPMKNNKWGPFFEDIPGWSDTEINADTLAWYLLEHPEKDATWRSDARNILDWTVSTLGNLDWIQYGVTPINEQTAYPVPGNSHTARHYSTELLYSRETGDTTRKDKALRGLHWATYMVDNDGKNYYPTNAIWLTDGYGDYVRHYLRAMAAAPELSPPGQNHLLESTSVIKEIHYKADSATYVTFDSSAREMLRIAFAPSTVLAGQAVLKRLEKRSDLDAQEGYTYSAPGDVPGVMRIRHDAASRITITGTVKLQAPIALNRSFEVEKKRSKKILLTALYSGSQGSQELKFRITKEPSHGMLKGSAPNLEYFPSGEYIGEDSFEYTISNGEGESNIGHIRIAVTAVNLARLPGTVPFTTENPTNGNAQFYVLDGIADDDLEATIAAGYNKSERREIGIGILWEAPKDFTTVLFHGGGCTNDKNGWFERGFRLQITADGVSWADHTGYSLTPGIDSSGRTDCGLVYQFDLPRRVTGRGIRIIGGIGQYGDEDSWFPQIKELRVFAGENAKIPSRPDLLISRPGDGVYFKYSDSTSWHYLGSPATSIIAGDLDGDGIDDPIGNWPKSGGVWAKLSSTGQWLLLASPADSIAVGDLNGDKRPDLIVSRSTEGVSYRSSATGEWIFVASPAERIAAGDLDEDGSEDLIGVWPAQGGVWVQYSSSKEWRLVAGAADWIATGDLDGDGRVELFGSWPQQGVYYQSRRTENWIRLASPASAVCSGDLDEDGSEDLIGIWPADGGLWVRYSKTGTWAILSESIDCAATGNLKRR